MFSPPSFAYKPCSRCLQTSGTWTAYQILPLGICDHIAGMALKQIRFDEEAGFAAAGTTDYQHVLISRMSRILGAVAHHQAFGLSQDHILLKHGISEGLDVLGCTP